MESTVQRFDFSKIPTKDGYRLNLSGIVGPIETQNGSFLKLQKILSDFFARRSLVDLIPIIEEGNETGKKLTGDLMTKCQENGLKVNQLKIIIFSTAINDAHPKNSNQKFDTEKLENMVVKKKKSMFSRIFRR